MNKRKFKVIGVGSPIVDLVSRVDESFIEAIPGKKGGMELVDSDTMQMLLNKLEDVPKKAYGGSAANTTFALARMGLACSFLGKLGKDENGKNYRKAFEKIGGNCSNFKYESDISTACCLSLVTPDYERTMRTDLGAAMNLSSKDISGTNIEGFTHAHVEGYLLFNPELIQTFLNEADRHNLVVSLDLGSYEVVDTARDMLPVLLKNHIDIVFANQDEAAHFTGCKNPVEALDVMSDYCDVVAIKLGNEGSLIRQGDTIIKITPMPVKNVVDTTGAGDYWAAGFLFGHINGYQLEKCGLLGSFLGGTAVKHFGADLPDATWNDILERIYNTLEEGNGTLWEKD